MGKLGLRARCLRWLSNLLWPGNHDRDLAKAAYNVYLVSNDIPSLDTAIERFQLAINQYRKHKKSPLVANLINYAVVVWKRFENCGRSQEDLDKVISLGSEAYAAWSSGQNNTNRFVVLLKVLAPAHFELYQRAFAQSPSGTKEGQQAFDKAVKYYTELKDNPAAADQKSSSRIQLGIMFRTRCELEHTLDQFDTGIDYLQNALMEATIAGKELDAGDGDEAQKEALDDIKATCLLNLADSYEMRYELARNPQKIDDLTLAINRNTDAKALLKPDHPDLPACLFNLARQLRSRWVYSGDKTDYDTAKEAAQAAQQIERADEQLKQSIDALLGLFEPGPPSRQGTVDSGMHMVDAPSRRETLNEASDNTRILQRRGTATSVDTHTVHAPSRRGTMDGAFDNAQILQRRSILVTSAADTHTMGAPSRRGTVASVDVRTLGAPSRRETMNEPSDTVHIPRRQGTVASYDPTHVQPQE